MLNLSPYAFFQFLPVLLKKKTFLNSLRFQEGVVISFFQNHWPDSVLGYCLNLNGSSILFKIWVPQIMALYFLNGKLLPLGVENYNISYIRVGGGEEIDEYFHF